MARVPMPSNKRSAGDTPTPGPSKLLKSKSEGVQKLNTGHDKCAKLRKTKSESNVSKRKNPLVFFDLETTGLRPCHILQLGAVSGTNQFNKYVMSKKELGQFTQEVVKLTMQKGKLCYNGEPVDAIHIKECLEEFLEFLGTLKHPPLLVAHYGHDFDAPVLIEAIRNVNMLESLEENIAGFVDTVPIFHDKYPGIFIKYTQKALVGKLLGDDYLYSPHNGLNDVVALRELFECMERDHGDVDLKPYTLSFDDF